MTFWFSMKCAKGAHHSEAMKGTTRWRKYEKEWRATGIQLIAWLLNDAIILDVYKNMYITTVYCLLTHPFCLLLMKAKHWSLIQHKCCLNKESLYGPTFPSWSELEGHQRQHRSGLVYCIRSRKENLGSHRKLKGLTTAGLVKSRQTKLFHSLFLCVYSRHFDHEGAAAELPRPPTCVFVVLFIASIQPPSLTKNQ